MGKGVLLYFSILTEVVNCHGGRGLLVRSIYRLTRLCKFVLEEGARAIH